MASVAPAPSSLPARAPPLSFKPIVVRGTQDSLPATPPRVPPKSARQQEKSKVVESNHRRTRTASGLWRIAPRIYLASVLRKPRIIATFLRYTSWEDFRGLARSSSEYRSLLRHTESKDVVLSHFVPGYRYCLHLADIANFRDVDITFRDLELFSPCFIAFCLSSSLDSYVCIHQWPPSVFCSTYTPCTHCPLFRRYISPRNSTIKLSAMSHSLRRTLDSSFYYNPSSTRHRSRSLKNHKKRVLSFATEASFIPLLMSGSLYSLLPCRTSLLHHHRTSSHPHSPVNLQAGGKRKAP